VTPPTPLPGTNLVQLRAWVSTPPDGASAAAQIERITLVPAFASLVPAPYDSMLRIIPRSRGEFAAPWEPQQRAAAVFQVPQPGKWSDTLIVAAGAQLLRFEVGLAVGGVSRTVTVLADGTEGLLVDWAAPRDYSIDLEVLAVDGEWRLGAHLA
jgi:hypothetical protein